jgi:hypothetical protein
MLCCLAGRQFAFVDGWLSGGQLAGNTDFHPHTEGNGKIKTEVAVALRYTTGYS